jgi:pimeloyl-ACP methyl ester carboxylesterase
LPLAKTKLKMPMLVLTGESASGDFLIQQGRMVVDNVEGVTVKGSGHWLMDEARDQVVPKLAGFFQVANAITVIPGACIASEPGILGAPE